MRVSPDSRPLPFNAHSQTKIDFQPRCSSSARSRASLAWLPVIFAFQKSVLLFGNLKRLQFSWPCQKQPFTKTSVRCLGNTMSGRPGKSRLCKRKRNPALCKARLTTNSGDVLRDFIAAIIRLRFSGLTMSAKLLMPAWRPQESSLIVHRSWNLPNSRPLHP